MEASHPITYEYSKNNMFPVHVLHQHIKGYSKNETFPSTLPNKVIYDYYIPSSIIEQNNQLKF